MGSFIGLALELGHAGLAAVEEAAEHAGAGRVHGVEDDVEAGVTNTVEIYQAFDLGVVGGTGIEGLDLALCDGLVELQAPRRSVSLAGRDGRFERLDDFGRGAAGVLRLELKAVIRSWVV